jgi:valyl-tRNA synthetase
MPPGGYAEPLPTRFLCQIFAMHELPKHFDHTSAQTRCRELWDAGKYWHAEPEAVGQPATRPVFSMVIPPPNVTGALHLGHALNNTLQDILVRARRMQGYLTLWMPGTDHAGIATQAVVERRLLEEEQLSRHDLGREKLVARIWQWKEQYEARILGQLRELGASCDWDRTRFTLDDRCAKAVREAFFRLFEKRLVRRGKRLVNWDTFLQTAVSDDEVFHEEVKGHFWHLRYEVIDPEAGEPSYVTVATTRPETLLGDTAVAVHPDPAGAFAAVDASLREKFAAAAAKEKAEIEAELEALADRRGTALAGLVQLATMAKAGRKVRLPLLGREIPLVADEWAKPEMGSGCVKITPAHDPNDYEVGLRQGLPMINILNPDGTLNAEAGPYAGLTIRKAREKVVADLEAAGQLEAVEDRVIDLAHSDRSKTPIEPYLADQWFIRMAEIAEPALDAVKNGEVKIHPVRYAKSYLDWLGEKRDWPVGRQLWWGHRIPIWHIADVTASDLEVAFADRSDVAWSEADGEPHDGSARRWFVCCREESLGLDAIAGQSLTRDPDVLDTWFSSALWPHSTLGWPESTPELARFYPTTTLVTSRDIITLWVARMVIMGVFDTGRVPFADVAIHPKILDRYGETMSKSKGNGVDPLDVIESLGADALRFGMASMATETQDVRMPVEFACPSCNHRIEQTTANRTKPRIECTKCGNPFRTQWASSDADLALPRGPAVSERFDAGRNFSNKLWNATRFVLMNLEGFEGGGIDAASPAEDLPLEEAWLRSRLASVTADVTAAIDAFRFADAARTLYAFAWDEYCSAYLELCKARLADPVTRAPAQAMLITGLDTILRLLHPIMPFVTEELWQHLREAAGSRRMPWDATAEDPAAVPAESVMIARWPAPPAAWIDAESEERFGTFLAIVAAIREIRARQNVPPKTVVTVVIKADHAKQALLAPMLGAVATMAVADVTDIGPDVEAPAMAAKVAAAGAEVAVDLAELVDVKAELVRVTKDHEKLAGLIEGKRKKLSNENFVARAPADVVEKEREQLTEMEERLAALASMADDLRSRS